MCPTDSSPEIPKATVRFGYEEDALEMEGENRGQEEQRTK